MVQKIKILEKKGAKSEDSQIEEIKSSEETCDMKDETPDEDQVPENIETEDI